MRNVQEKLDKNYFFFEKKDIHQIFMTHIYSRLTSKLTIRNVNY